MRRTTSPRRSEISAPGAAAKLKGLILNSKNLESEAEIVEKACAEIGTGIVEIIPRCADIQFAENKGCTVFEALEASK